MSDVTKNINSIEGADVVKKGEEKRHTDIF